MKRTTLLSLCLIAIVNSRQFDKKQLDKINLKINKHFNNNFYNNVASGFGDFDNDDDDAEFGSGFIGNYYQFLFYYF